MLTLLVPGVGMGGGGFTVPDVFGPPMPVSVALAGGALRAPMLGGQLDTDVPAYPVRIDLEG